MPAGHGPQLVAPKNCPAAHAEHAAEPGAEKVFVAHVKHVAEVEDSVEVE